MVEVINNHPCTLLREVVTRVDAMAVLLGIVTEKLCHVLIAQQFIFVGKEGMHSCAVLDSMLLSPLFEGCIGSHQFWRCTYPW